MLEQKRLLRVLRHFAVWQYAHYRRADISPNIWRITESINYFWFRKYAHIVVLGHYLFLEAHSGPRSSLSGNSSLLGQLSVYISSRKVVYTPRINTLSDGKVHHLKKLLLPLNRLTADDATPKTLLFFFWPDPESEDQVDISDISLSDVFNGSADTTPGRPSLSSRASNLSAMSCDSTFSTVHTRTRTHAHTRVQTRSHTRSAYTRDTHARTLTHMRTHTCMHTRTHTRHARIHGRTQTRIHAHTHATHTHTCARTHATRTHTPTHTSFVLCDPKPRSNGPSQLKTTRAKLTTSRELGIVWSPTWLELARVGSGWLEFDQAQIFARLEPSFPPFNHLSQLKPTLTKFFCYCCVTTRS